MEIIEIEGIYLIIMVICTILSLTGTSICCMVAIFAFTKAQALEKSTHTVHFQPVDEAWDKENENYTSQKWATSEAELKKQQNLFKEDLEELMPDLALSDEDREITSF